MAGDVSDGVPAQGVVAMALPPVAASVAGATNVSRANGTPRSAVPSARPVDIAIPGAPSATVEAGGSPFAGGGSAPVPSPVPNPLKKGEVGLVGETGADRTGFPSPPVPTDAMRDMPGAPAIGGTAFAGPVAPDDAPSPGAPVPLPRLREEIARRTPPLLEASESDSVRLRTAPRTAEVELAPAELGRLRLHLNTTERGVHLSVLVERPESLETVRRHLDGLHRSLIAEGVTLDSIDIGTGSGARDQRQSADGKAGPAPRQIAVPPHDAAPDTPPAPPSPSPIGPGRLDIRL